MGRVHFEHLGGRYVYVCLKLNCRVYLTNSDQGKPKPGAEDMGAHFEDTDDGYVTFFARVSNVSITGRVVGAFWSWKLFFICMVVWKCSRYFEVLALKLTVLGTQKLKFLYLCFDNFSRLSLKYLLIFRGVLFSFFHKTLADLNFFQISREWEVRETPIGKYCVREVTCKKCDERLGWFYEFAPEASQRWVYNETLSYLWK